jgi:hypothetical protein
MKTLTKLRTDAAMVHAQIEGTIKLIDRNPGVAEFQEQLVRLAGEFETLKQETFKRSPFMLIGIDPAMGRSGYAYQSNDGPMAWGHLDGIEHLSDSEAVNLLRIELAETDPAKVYAMVEYPTWHGYGTDQVRAAANCWIRTLRAAIGSRLRIRKVTPQVWMGHLGFLSGPRLPKGQRPPVSEKYIPFALEAARAAPPMDENAAAAVCLVAYSEDLLWSGKWSAPKAKPQLKEAA